MKTQKNAQTGSLLSKSQAEPSLKGAAYISCKETGKLDRETDRIIYFSFFKITKPILPLGTRCICMCRK
jgi:hypothetical protein